MRFKLTIHCDNAAFDDLGAEIGYILAQTADKVRDGDTSGAAMDSNGNTVGSWGLTGKRVGQ